jgi:uncharacterized membrane protein YgdD (TMEM256/DUF423 family)
MKWNWGIIASLSLALAVLFGAFGAHILKDKLSEYNLKIYDKAVFYQFIHSIGLLFIGIFLIGRNIKMFRLSALFLFLGIILFSGSLYILSISGFQMNTTITKIVGPLTPLGGLCFVIGWLFLGWGMKENMK